MFFKNFNATNSLLVLAVLGFATSTILCLKDSEKYGNPYFGLVGNLSSAVIALSRGKEPEK